MINYLKKISTLIISAIILSSSISVYAQYDELRIYSGKDVYSIPAAAKGDNVFFSVEDFAKALSINTYFNSKTKKIELKFSGYKLKITAGNPFFIFTSKITKRKEIHQLPNSSFIIRDKIFVSLKYILPLLKRALAKNLVIKGKYKLIIGKKTNIPENIIVTKKPPIKKYKYGITGISVSDKSNGTLVRIKSKQKIVTYNSTFKNGELKIIFRNVNAKTEDIRYNNSSNFIEDIIVRNINEDTELIIKVGDDYISNDVINANKGNDILILLHNKILTTSTEVDKNKQKWNFDVIVIDAGHGGIDGGTYGVYGIKEKDVNLAIALKLGRILEKKMKAVQNNDYELEIREEDLNVDELYKYLAASDVFL
ncbi:MAG: N-acetylmuramoyl-L-alanine amidase, partial [Bacteroidetes bacterium]|nr:N-acetylmuramoyl-L-alanine amidase [Bacteroidota bacterium]